MVVSMHAITTIDQQRLDGVTLWIDEPQHVRSGTTGDSITVQCLVVVFIE